jgi:hypothetical protein
LLGVALATWSVDDPSFNHALDRRKLAGLSGAAVADELMQFLGRGAVQVIPMTWAVRSAIMESLDRSARCQPGWHAPSPSARLSAPRRLLGLVAALALAMPETCSTTCC